MSAGKESLARRAVVAWEECGLDWMPRMGLIDGWRGDRWTVLAVDKNGRLLAMEDPHRGKGEFLSYADGPIWLDPHIGHRPNLDDPATLGCIEHGMLPAAWGPGCIISVKRWTSSDGKVTADIHVHELSGSCPMLFGVVDVPLAEGLVLCLEAAERRKP